MASDPEHRVDGILETCLYVDDLEKAEQFYCQSLGLTFLSRQVGRHVFLRCDDQMLLIFDPTESAKQDGDLPPHGAVGSGHVAFAVLESTLDDWKARLKTGGVPIEQEVQWPGGGRSFYFRDPAGNSVELATRKIWGFEE